MVVSVRKGTENDIRQALSLVKELAEYEKCPGEVEVTEQEMHNWCFGDQPVFEFFVLEYQGEIVGTAIYYYKYSTWKGRCLFLEDIVVTQQHRRRGFGTLLFNEVVKVAKKEKVRRLEWQVLEWNSSAIEFYRKYNAIFDPEWINCKLDHQQIQNLKD